MKHVENYVLLARELIINTKMGNVKYLCRLIMICVLSTYDLCVIYINIAIRVINILYKWHV